MLQTRQVVVVDGVPETALVLSAVLEPLGHSVTRVRGYERRVLDANAVVVVHETASATGDEYDRFGSTPRVVVGPIRYGRPEGSAGTIRLEQPFEYVDLIRAVERLIETAVPERAAA